MCSASSLLVESINGAERDEEETSHPDMVVLIRVLDCKYISAVIQLQRPNGSVLSSLLRLKGNALHTEGDYCSLFLLEETACCLLQATNSGCVSKLHCYATLSVTTGRVC